ncbi:hypothetical protein [Acetobacter conturbans]|uniref:hypothetical protein n=1 Tax=Acetobacter conturbans TaxID=1737472 RepID=UPI0018E94D22|nr:hypothetical protein [Acetobacter conturbans]
MRNPRIIPARAEGPIDNRPVDRPVAWAFAISRPFASTIRDQTTSSSKKCAKCTKNATIWLSGLVDSMVNAADDADIRHALHYEYPKEYGATPRQAGTPPACRRPERHSPDRGDADGTIPSKRDQHAGR